MNLTAGFEEKCLAFLSAKVPKVTCYAEAKVDIVKVPKVPKVGMTDGANETPSPTLPTHPIRKIIMAMPVVSVY